jgi:hypothetical protein
MLHFVPIEKKGGEEKNTPVIILNLPKKQTKQKQKQTKTKKNKTKKIPAAGRLYPQQFSVLFVLLQCQVSVLFLSFPSKV